MGKSKIATRKPDIIDNIEQNASSKEIPGSSNTEKTKRGTIWRKPVIIAALIAGFFGLIGIFLNKYLPPVIPTIPTATTSATSDPFIISIPTKPLQPQTIAPTMIPTITPTWPSPVNMPDYVITNCIRADVWRFWPETNDPPHQELGDLDCYDLHEFGMEAKQDIDSESYGLRIKYNSGMGGKSGAIFYPIPQTQTINISLNISSLKSEMVCGEGKFCDANLFIGIGENPIISSSGGSFFLTFRSADANTPEMLCLLDTLYVWCTKKEKIDLNDLEQEIKIQFVFDGLDYLVKVNDYIVDVPHMSISISNRKLWIGYNFRSKGSVDAFISFEENGNQ